jgi:NAD(P)-dependent dehydrogenase (short-subunit alcohol dehydrogenase family)
MASFTGKHIVITGGVKGIGRACVDVMIREGGKVSVLDIDNNVTADYEGNAKFYQTDVSKADQVQEGIGAAIKQFGDVDVLVNNAGIVKSGTSFSALILKVTFCVLDIAFLPCSGREMVLSSMWRVSRHSSASNAWLLILRRNRHSWD